MIILMLILLGLSFGSFTNALVWRLHELDKKKPKYSRNRLSIARGRSMCVHCGHELAPRDLVPVLSWLLLWGKCRYCRVAIPDTPLPEVVTPLLFVVSYLVWPYGFSGVGLFQFIVWLVLLVGFVALSMYDYRWKLLPNKIVYPVGAVVLVQVIVQVATGEGWSRILAALWGVVLGAGIFELIYRLSKGKLIGGGDIRLGVVYGLLLGGPVQSMLCIFIASVFGTLVAVPSLLRGNTKATTKIPFGPYLIAATIVVYLWGAGIVQWYRTAAGI